MSIKLIVGLGNPGLEYEQTRHNAGFWTIDNFAYQNKFVWQKESKFSALVSKNKINGEDIWLIKPQTFMNRSGQAVGTIAKFFKIQPEEILVIHDELDIMPGIAKLKKGGSTGGHNGLKDIVASLGSQNFWRLRIGVGHPRSQNLKTSVIDYVLQRPKIADQDLINESIEHAIGIIPLLIENQFDKAMLQLHTIK